MSDSVWPQRRQPTRLLCPWDSPGKNTGVGCHFLLQYTKVKSEREVAQSYPTLSDPMDCSLPGSSIHRIFQARALGRKPSKSPWSLFWFLFASLSSYLQENKQTGFGREVHGQENRTKAQAESSLRTLFSCCTVSWDKPLCVKVLSLRSKSENTKTIY